MGTLMYCNFYLLFLFFIVTHSKILKSVPSHNSLRTVNHRQQLSSVMLRAQNFEVAPGINYEYICLNGNTNNDSKPTILFLHGFPSSFRSWCHQVEYFARQGYRTLAPNMMGYGKTYSPSNTNEYRVKAMIEHLVALLNYLQMNKVIVVGHDWGTRVAGRFALYQPERTVGVALISGTYNAPALFDINRALEASKQAVGYEIYGHWTFFDADDAAILIKNNLESFIELVFASDPTLWRTHFAPVGKLRDWMVNGNRTTRASFIPENDYAILRQYFIEAMQPKMNWFKATIANVDWNDEKDLDPVVKRPMLLIGGKKDYVSLIASYGGPNQYVADLETVALETGHWVMEEDPQAVNRELDRWIKRILRI